MTMRSIGEFPDPEIFAAKTEIRERFESVLTGLWKVCRNRPVICDKLSKFRGFISEPSCDGEARLPVFVKSRLSHNCDKGICILNTLSTVVQAYWNFCTSDNFVYIHLIRYELDLLEAVAEKGLDAFELVGERFPGYVLKEKT